MIKRRGPSQSGQVVRYYSCSFISSHSESDLDVCDIPILALGRLFSGTYQLTWLKKHSMPKQFRLKITLWAIFFFFTHPTESICLSTRSLLHECFHSCLLLPENRVDTIRKVRIGVRHTEQNHADATRLCNYQVFRE